MTAAASNLQAPLTTLWRWCVLTSDLDAQARAQPQWRQQYEQISPGRFSGLLHHVQLPGVRLVREDSHCALHQRGDLGQAAYGFALPLTQSGPAIFSGQRVEGDAIMVGRSDELDLVTPTHFSLIAAVVDADLLLPLWERLYQKTPSAWLDKQLVLPARPAAAVLRQMHLAALRDLAAADAPWHDPTALAQLRDALLMEWIEALPERVDTSLWPTVAARKRLVDRACERMLAGAEEPLSMLSVCREVGASRRKLNHCFQDVLGTSPVKYLRSVRLNGVRRELRTGRAGSVQEAAARWGFWHLGQFARDYKRQFAELPSATLRGTDDNRTERFA